MKAKIDVSLRQLPAAYWKYLLATALFGFGNSSNAFLILRTRDIGASLELTILIYAAFNLVAAVVSYPAGTFSDSWGAKNLLLVSFIIFLIGYLGFALTQNVVLIAGLFAFYGLFQGIFRTAGKAMASSFVPDRLRASGIGWYNTTVGFYSLSRASSQASFGTGSGMWPCFTTEHSLLSWCFRTVVIDSRDTRSSASLEVSTGRQAPREKSRSLKTMLSPVRSKCIAPSVRRPHAQGCGNDT